MSTEQTNNRLYPIKFTPIYKHKVWGGSKFTEILKRQNVPFEHCGESWELSGVADNFSLVSNGILKGTSIQELITSYKGDLMGKHVYEQYGMSFPLLIKFLDVSDVLSIQVHPNDAVAKERHQSFGKTEMMYIVFAEDDAKMISGFKTDVSSAILLDALQKKQMPHIVNIEQAQCGDVFYIPAGRIHAPGKGMLVAEIQQTSDLTYRIYDWDRPDDNGKMRELHVDLALDCLDYRGLNSAKTPYATHNNASSQIIANKYFTVNVIIADKPFLKDYHNVDSFVIFLCVEGHAELKYDEGKSLSISFGETVLIPAQLKTLTIIPANTVRILEVFHQK